MSKFYPDVRDEEGIEAGANWGAMAAIGLGFLALLSAVPSFYAVVRSAGIEGAGAFLLVNAITFGLIVLDAVFCFVAAWRFMRRQGFVIGIILTVLSVFGLLITLARIAFTSVPAWQLAVMLLYMPILYGLFHGVRAARGAKRLGVLAKTDLGRVFE